MRPVSSGSAVNALQLYRLSSFKAVRDVFLPATRQWLGDYPFVSRRGFQQVRDRINYQRREEGAGGYRANF